MTHRRRLGAREPGAGLITEGDVQAGSREVGPADYGCHVVTTVQLTVIRPSPSSCPFRHRSGLAPSRSRNTSSTRLEHGSEPVSAAAREHDRHQGRTDAGAGTPAGARAFRAAARSPRKRRHAHRSFCCARRPGNGGALRSRKRPLVHSVPLCGQHSAVLRISSSSFTS
jgi:hypothetical protein